MAAKSARIAMSGMIAFAMTLPVAAGIVAGRVAAPSVSDFKRPDGAGSGRVGDDRVWAVGRKIFFDPGMSASATISCATCHQPSQGWTDRLPKAIGEAHKPLAFRAPSLLNVGYIDRYGWSGRFASVESTAFFAMIAPTNMNVPIAKTIEKLKADPAYVEDFRGAFADGAISKQNIGVALDRFVASIVSDTAPFDLWVDGDTSAISPAAVRGFAIFNGKGKCAECHRGWAFTDGSFHDVGTAKGADLGRGAFFKTSIKLQYAYKTPTLRDVAVRPPYMHDGSIQTLEGVIDHYDEGGIDRPSRDEAIRPLHLSPDEKQDLVEFLKTLSGGSRFAIKSDS